MTDSNPCPCQSGRETAQCCGAILAGRQRAATAEALMRSRYCAYLTGDRAYLLRTWHPTTRPPAIEADRDLSWCGLEIIRTDQGGEEDQTGLVEFKATGHRHHRLLALHETSRFVKEDGQWYYVGGELLAVPRRVVPAPEKTGRNHPCPCGSGRKFKKCCGKDAT